MQKNYTDWWDDYEDNASEAYVPPFQRKNQRLKDQRAFELEKEKYNKRKRSLKVSKDVTSFTTTGKDVDVTSLKTNA